MRVRELTTAQKAASWRWIAGLAEVMADGDADAEGDTEEAQRLHAREVIAPFLRRMAGRIDRGQGHKRGRL